MVSDSRTCLFLIKTRVLLLRKRRVRQSPVKASVTVAYKSECDSRSLALLCYERKRKKTPPFYLLCVDRLLRNVSQQITCVSDLLVTVMARIRKHDRKRAEKRAKGRAHSENKETTSTFGNDEHIRKPRKPRIDEHIRKRVEKRAKGPDRRTQYDIYVTVIFRSYRKLEGKVSPEIRPVNKWNKFTAIKIQGGCPGGTGTDLGFHIICQDNNRNHLDERVHLLIKCPDCPNCHCFLKIKGWVDEETSIPMNCRTKIGKIECSGFEPIGGVGMLEFMDDFSVHSTCGESVGLMIRLGQRVDVVVNGPHGHIALGEIIGINVDYERQSC